MPFQTFHCAAVGFEAARQIQHLPTDHPSGRLHGHSFVAKVRCALPAGWAAFAGGEVEQLKTALAQLSAFTGKKVRGWMSPGLAQTFDTADYLRKHGPFEPHRLSLDEMEYTTMPEVGERLAARWQALAAPRP